jgi:hypothetical protein
LSPSICFGGFTLRISRSRPGSHVLHPVNKMAMRRPFSICECVNLRVAPSSRTANSLLLLPPFPPAAERCALTCVESIICVSADRPFPASSRNRLSQMPPSCPAHEAVIDRRMRTIYLGAIAPAAAALENVYDSADDAAVVYPCDTAHIRRQMRLDPGHRSSLSQNRFLLIGPSPNTNHHRIVEAEGSMSSDPSSVLGSSNACTR